MYNLQPRVLQHQIMRTQLKIQHFGSKRMNSFGIKLLIALKIQYTFSSFHQKTQRKI